MEKETNEVERKDETEMGVKKELSEISEVNGKHLAREKSQGIRESIKKDSELVIHHNYTNKSNRCFSIILKVILQSFIPYNDPFDDVVKVPYAYEGINGGFILYKKNLRYACFKFKRKHSEFNAHKYKNGSSMYQVCKQVQIVLKLFVWIGTSKKKFSTQMFVFDPGGYLNISTSKDGYDSRTNHL